MFARRVHMHLKPNSVAEFTQKLEKDVLPLLRKQQGFRDEITFVSHDGREGFGGSLWAKRDNAQPYSPGTYPEETKILTTVFWRAPEFQPYHSAHPTLPTLSPPPPPRH